MYSSIQRCGGYYYSWHGYCYLLTTLAYSLTHSTPHGATNTTILSTTSYPYALTMVVRVMCTYVSWCPWVMCIPVGLCVGGCASAIGCSRLQYFLVLHPEWAQYYSSLRLLQVLLHSSVHDTTTRTSYGTSISSYPSVSWSVILSATLQHPCA